MDLLGAAGVVIRVRSALGGVTLGDAASGGGGGAGSAVLSRLYSLLRPDVSVTAGGVELVRFKPAGDPPAFPWLGAVVVVGVVGPLVGLGWLLGRRSR